MESKTQTKSALLELDFIEWLDLGVEEGSPAISFSSCLSRVSAPSEVYTMSNAFIAVRLSPFSMYF